MSEQSEHSLKWCNFCGEGVVNFCRGNCGDADCPMKLPNPMKLSSLNDEKTSANFVTSITLACRDFPKHQNS